VLAQVIGFIHIDPHGLYLRHRNHAVHGCETLLVHPVHDLMKSEHVGIQESVEFPVSIGIVVQPEHSQGQIRGVQDLLVRWIHQFHLESERDIGLFDEAAAVRKSVLLGADELPNQGDFRRLQPEYPLIGYGAVDLAEGQAMIARQGDLAGQSHIARA